MAAAAHIERGAAAGYRCIRNKRLWSSVAEFLPCKSKAKIAGEGGYLRDKSTFNFQQELKALTLSIAAAMNPKLGFDWSQAREFRFRIDKSLLYFSMCQLLLHSPTEVRGGGYPSTFHLEYLHSSFMPKNCLCVNHLWVARLSISGSMHHDKFNDYR